MANEPKEWKMQFQTSIWGKFLWSEANLESTKPHRFFNCHHDRSCQRTAKTNRPFVIQADKAKGGLSSWKWGLQRLQSHWFEACNFLVKCSPAEMRAYLHFFGKKMGAVIQTKIDDSQVVLQWALGWSLCTYTGWPWEHSCDVETHQTEHISQH